VVGEGGPKKKGRRYFEQLVQYQVLVCFCSHRTAVLWSMYHSERSSVSLALIMKEKSNILGPSQSEFTLLPLFIKQVSVGLLCWRGLIMT
jgi:hypothetical protein